MSKCMSLEEAVNLVKDGDSLWLSGGGGGINDPGYLLSGLEKRFLDTGSPAGLTLYHSAGIGDKQGGGADHFAHKGMVRKVVGSHWTWSVNMQKLAMENQIEAYVLPQGVMTQLVREIAAGRPGLITKTGLHTFVDPRVEGGRVNECSKEELSFLFTKDVNDYIFYKSFHLDVALFRGSAADEDGNISFEDEGLMTEALSQAQAVKNCGGVVICQVKRMVERGGIRPDCVAVPGILVDAVVVDSRQRMSMKTEYDETLSGKKRGGLPESEYMPQDNRKVMAKRAAMELKRGDMVNLGFGVPAGVGKVLEESGCRSCIHLSLEQGIIGGVPATGTDFGIAYNPQAIICETNQFDWYDGGGLDVAVLSFAEFDRQGNVNVSKFNHVVNGVGGFINISQNAGRVVFTGTFTAVGLREECKEGRLQILQEGRVQKLVDTVEQVSFSGPYARQTGQPVLFVTERAVFRLADEGVELTEIAPGIDLQKDVLDVMGFEPIVSRYLKVMDPQLFQDIPVKLNL